MGFLWVNGFSFFHCVASPFHSFVTTSSTVLNHRVLVCFREVLHALELPRPSCVTMKCEARTARLKQHGLASPEACKGCMCTVLHSQQLRCEHACHCVYVSVKGRSNSLLLSVGERIGTHAQKGLATSHQYSLTRTTSLHNQHSHSRRPTQLPL